MNAILFEITQAVPWRSSSAPSSSRRYNNKPFIKLSNTNSQMNNRNIMAAILQSRGPIVTPAATKHNWNFLHMMSTKQFIKAGGALQDLRLGNLVSVKTRGGKHASVFVKKAPADVALDLSEHPDLCSLEYYEMRYNTQIAKSLADISLMIRQHFAEAGQVPAHLLNMPSTPLS